MDRGGRGAGYHRGESAGRQVPPGPWPLLAGAAGKPVELTIRPASADSEARRRVVVVPLRSDRRLRYQDWVAGRRRAVRELSEGRLGYLHIPDMMGEGWADFHRDLRTEMARDGLIFDVRGNSGGHISELVVEKLARRVIGWCLGRWMRPESYPQEARRPDRVRRHRLHHPHGPAAAQPGLDDRPRAAARRGHGQPGRPAVPAPGPLRGRVVDWINLPHFPWTFNLADASITCAAVLIAVLALRGVRIDGTSPAHAADRTEGAFPARAVDGDGAARLADRGECPS